MVPTFSTVRYVCRACGRSMLTAIIHPKHHEHEQYKWDYCAFCVGCVLPNPTITVAAN